MFQNELCPPAPSACSNQHLITLETLTTTPKDLSKRPQLCRGQANPALQHECIMLWMYRLLPFLSRSFRLAWRRPDFRLNCLQNKKVIHAGGRTMRIAQGCWDSHIHTTSLSTNLSRSSTYACMYICIHPQTNKHVHPRTHKRKHTHKIMRHPIRCTCFSHR